MNKEIKKVAVLCTEENKCDRLIKAFDAIGVKNSNHLTCEFTNEFYCPDDDNNLIIYSGENLIVEYRIITIEELEAMGRGENVQANEQVKEQPKERHILDWFNSIADEKIRREAIENYDGGLEDSKPMQSTLRNAISIGFIWANSLQGYDYWENIADLADLNWLTAREVPDGKWEKKDGKWVNILDSEPSVSLNDEAATAQAIQLLKSKGYKVMRPVTTFEEA